MQITKEQAHAFYDYIVRANRDVPRTILPVGLGDAEMMLPIISALAAAVRGEVVIEVKPVPSEAGADQTAP